MWASYLLFLMGATIVATMIWCFWTAIAQNRIYLGRRNMRWLNKSDDPRRFRINLIFLAFPFLGGLWMMSLALGWL